MHSAFSYEYNFKINAFFVKKKPLKIEDFLNQNYFKFNKYKYIYKYKY